MAAERATPSSHRGLEAHFPGHERPNSKPEHTGTKLFFVPVPTLNIVIAGSTHMASPESPDSGSPLTPSPAPIPIPIPRLPQCRPPSNPPSDRQAPPSRPSTSHDAAPLMTGSSPSSRTAVPGRRLPWPPALPVNPMPINTPKGKGTRPLPQLRGILKAHWGERVCGTSSYLFYRVNAYGANAPPVSHDSQRYPPPVS